MCPICRQYLFVDTACFCGRTKNQIRKVLIVTFSDDHNLNDFKRIWSLPPMWRNSKSYGQLWLLSGQQCCLHWAQECHITCLKTRCLLEKNRSILCSQPVFPVLTNEKKDAQITDDFYLHNQVLLAVFPSIPKRTQKVFLLSYETALVTVFFWGTCFILSIQKLYTYRLEIWFLWDESWRRSFSNKLHRFWKQFPKQSDFG